MDGLPFDVGNDGHVASPIPGHAHRDCERVVFSSEMKTEALKALPRLQKEQVNGQHAIDLASAARP